MKTSVVYEYKARPGSLTTYHRAPLPAEADPERERREGTRVARFVPAHDYTFHYLGDKPGTERKGHRPDTVAVGATEFFFPADQVRVVPADYVERLDALDRQMAELEQERRDLAAEAFRRGRKIKKADLVEVGEVKP
jgi:hypothetical protein